MNKTYLLQNLNCAHCAAKIEKQLNSLPKVQSATVNFLTQKLHIQTQEYASEQLTKEIFACISKESSKIIIKELS